MTLTTGTASEQQMASAQCTAELLLYRHYRNIDTGQATASLELFAPDAAVTARGNTTHGRDELAVSLGRREANTGRVTQHLITNLEVLKADEETIVVTGILTIHARGSQSNPERVARFTTELTFLDGSWFIAATTPDESTAVNA